MKKTGILGNKEAQAKLLKNPLAHLFALLCKAGYIKEACKIILDETKRRERIDNENNIHSQEV